MTEEEILSTLKSEEILDTYKEKFGSIKFEKIVQEIVQAKRSAQLIANSITQQVIPTGEDFVECVTDNWRYVFASSEKIKVASICLLGLWAERLNQQPNLDINIKDIAKIEERIIEKCDNL